MAGNVRCQSAILMRDEINHRGRAAKGGSLSAGIVIIRGNRAAHRQVKVHMGVNPPG